jgi:hypothetical protein
LTQPVSQDREKHFLQHRTTNQKNHDHIATWHEQQNQQRKHPSSHKLNRTTPMGARETPSNTAVYQQSSQVEQKLQK